MASKLINRYYITTFISELARTIPHPVLIILLIDQKGLSLSEITFIQIFFYLGVLLFEIPSGYLADLGYRKSGYVMSFICMVVAYSMIYLSVSIPILCIAWFIYGIGGALLSGNIDGYIVNQLKQEGNERKIKQFNIRKTNMSLSAGIGGALIGSLLYPVIKTNIYMISLILYTIAIVICLLGIHVKHTPGTITKFKLRDISWTNKLKVLIVMICLIELYYVGFYQYWQVLYQAKGIDPIFFGIIYIVFSITVITSNKLYGKINSIKEYITIPIFLLASITSIFYLNSIIFCIVYPITLFIANLYVIDIYTKIYEEADERSTSSIISIVSSSNRLFGMVILAVLTVALNHFELSLILIVLYSLFAISFLILNKYIRN